MGNFKFDQAEGLRRLIGGPKPRVYTVLSATSEQEKCAMLVNLSAALAQTSSDVLLMDASVRCNGVSRRLEAAQGATLLQVARQERALDEVVQSLPQGFALAALTRGAQRIDVDDAHQQRQLNTAFNALAARADILVVDAELDSDDQFPFGALAEGEIVIQLSVNPDSITVAYTLIKRLCEKYGRRPFNVVVTGACDSEAQLVFKNLTQVANRYLAVNLVSLGSVPSDDHVRRATGLGRAVVDAFPMAMASVAFRRLASQFSVTEMSSAGLMGLPDNSATFRI